MEVVVLSPNNGSPTTMDNFDFNRARISPPYLSAPSSPKRFGEGYYMSAPTSPTRFSDVCGADFDYFVPSSPLTLYHWEDDKPDSHKSNHSDDDDDDDDDEGFAFNVGGGSEASSRSAEELFHGGKIKPLKGDRELMESSRRPLLSPKNPRSNSPIIAQGKKGIRETVSSQKKKLESCDPSGGERRGRERAPPGSGGGSFSVSKSGRRVTRSLSPFRVSDSTWDEEFPQQAQQNSNKELLSSTSSSSSKSSSRKWRLRDLLLFRSASEGRGSSKDPFRKYAVMFRKSEEGKVSSFRSSDQNPMIPKPRRKEPISAHELHYARKKAEAEDLKKRTFLPYKQGILGRLAGLGSLSK